MQKYQTWVVTCLFSLFVVTSVDFFFYTGSHGEWKSEGCKIVMKTDNMTTVQCSHLTNFAILKVTIRTID